jgi:GT2 family glycosyltransferase/glycosyltransferase involved in cell wall biosynthesis
MATVVLTSYSGVLGGAERALIDFAGGLPGELWLACPPGPFAAAGAAAGLRVAPLRARPLEFRRGARGRLLAVGRLAVHAREVRALISDLEPDLLIACGMRSALATVGVPPPVVFQHNDMLPRGLLGRAVRTAANRAALVITPSRAVAEELSAACRVVVVHPGVDLERFAAAGAVAEPDTVLVLGALVGWKRPDLALEAAALARRSRPGLRLRLAGAPLGRSSDALVASLRARVAAHDLAGAVEFVGPVDDVAAELGRAACLLHCADREPFGLVVLEALASGRPAVVPCSGGVTEIVDSSCALLYPPGDAAAAGKALVELLSDPRRAAAMGANGRARARARFSLTESAARFAEAVSPVLGSGPARSRAKPPLALVTVTHNSRAELAALLDSVERHLRGCRVVVVDNASRDETVALASGRAVVIALEQNVGFGTACNRGVQAVSEQVTALINPDVELLDGSLAALAEEALRGPERLLAPRVLGSDGSRQDSVHPTPTSAADLLRAVVPPAALPGSLGVALAPWRSRSPRHVGWAVGCALVARTETLRRLGPFDERIFMYGEDLDLGLRAAAAGVPTWFWPDARVLHHGAHATVPAFGGEAFERLAQARHDVIAGRLGVRRGRLDDLTQAVTFGSRIALKRTLRRSVARERRQLRAVRAVRRSVAR